MARETATKTTQKPRTSFGGALTRARSQQAPAKAGQQPAAPAGGRLRRYLREVKVEMGKVTWPARKEVGQATAVVIVAVIIASVYIGVLDVIWSYLVKLVRLG